MRIRTLLGIGTVLLGTAGAFAARPHEEVRVPEPARIVQPVQEYKVDVRHDGDDARFNRQDDRFDRRDDRFDRRDDRRDARDGHWNGYGHEIVIAPDCR